MKSKKNILAAIAAMSVMASAMSLNAFAAEEAENTDVALTAAAVEEVAEEETSEEEVVVEAPELIVPADDAEKPVPPEPPVILDVTDFIDQIRTFIDANSIDILTDTILENWDQIEKVDVHFHANEKPEPPVAPEDAEKPEVDEEVAEEVAEEEDAEDSEKPEKPLGPVHLELTDLFMQFRDKVDLSKVDFIDDETKEKILNAKDVHADVHFVNPNKPEPPVAPEEGELPTPPAPPVAPEEGELPTPPAPPVAPEAPKGPAHEHLGPKEREALKAAEAEATTEAVAEETTEAASDAEISE